jgi:hypothetical protein
MRYYITPASFCCTLTDTFSCRYGRDGNDASSSLLQLDMNTAWLPPPLLPPQSTHSYIDTTLPGHRPADVRSQRREQTISASMLLQRARAQWRSICKLQRRHHSIRPLTAGVVFVQTAFAMKRPATAPPTRRVLCWFQSHPA